MGLRFRKSIRLVPGVRLNIGLRRTSLSLGGKGFTYNVGSRGSRITVGIPGSGLSYTTPVSYQSSVSLPAVSPVAKRRFSATPFVIAAFLIGLTYISLHSTTNQNLSQSTPSRPYADQADVTASIANSAPTARALEAPVPLPRPRPKLSSERIGPPLQIVPQ